MAAKIVQRIQNTNLQLIKVLIKTTSVCHLLLSTRIELHDWDCSSPVIEGKLLSNGWHMCLFWALLWTLSPGRSNHHQLASWSVVSSALWITWITALITSESHCSDISVRRVVIRQSLLHIVWLAQVLLRSLSHPVDGGKLSQTAVICCLPFLYRFAVVEVLDNNTQLS